MLNALFGNQNVQKILIFLFVNGKCYGTELHRCLKTPLTPVQKALLRLEKGGVIISHYEGKTRIYRMNPAFPLNAELDSLLKKAYTLLSPEEKKTYYVNHQDQAFKDLNNTNRMRTLLDFWNKLSSVNQLSFRAKSKSGDKSGWNGQGKGDVFVTKDGSNVLVFSEKGLWESKEKKEISFKNVFRWKLDRVAEMISLEHLRRGPSNPVFLFHLTPTTKSSLSSVDSHLCEGDIYFGQIHFDRYSLRLNWRVIGPKKNEEIDYFYSL